MANSFISIDQIAFSALDFLQRKATLLNAVWLDVVDAGVAAGTGSIITVRTPASATAADFSGTVSTQDITEGSVDLTLNKDKEVSFKWTEKEQASSVSEIEQLMIVPAMDALLKTIETDIEADMRADLITDTREFGDSVYGNQVTIDDIADGRRALNVNDVSRDDRFLFLSPKDSKGFASDPIFTDISASQKDTLMTGELGTVLGFRTVESNAIVTNTVPAPDETYNLFFHKTEYTVGMRALQNPNVAGVEFAAASHEGLTINVTRQWDFSSQATVVVFRALYGTKTLDTGRGGILKG